MKNKDITAIILAGGQSSRMGYDKALITIEGQTLIERICTVASICADNIYVVTRWTEKYKHLVSKKCELIQEIYHNSETPHGPLIGFFQGLHYVKTEWVLLLACDLPLLNQQEVEKWTSYLKETSLEFIALLPKNIKGWEPLSGFYRRECLPLLEEFIAQGGKSFQKWLAKYPVKELPLSDQKVLFNCNTPQDLKCIHQN